MNKKIKHSSNSPDCSETSSIWKNSRLYWQRMIVILTSLTLVSAGTVQSQVTINVPSGKTTIQEAVNAAQDGDIINIANGTYTLNATLNLNKSLTIQGESEAGVIIDAKNTPALGWGINPNKSNTTLKNLTILPNPNGGYPIHVGDNGTPVVISNVTLSHITIIGAPKSAFDCNGVDNLTLEYLTAKNTASGVGVAISGCSNVTARYISTENNTWGGLAVYVSRNAPSGVGRGSSNVTIDGTTINSTEANKIFVQDEYGFTNTNITVNGFDYIIQNLTSKNGYSFYQSNLTTAFGFAAALGTPADSYVKQISNGQYWVSPALKLQKAIDVAQPGSTINAIAGTYDEEINVTKAVNLKGAGVDASIIRGPKTGSVNTILMSASNILFDGFTITRDGNNIADWNTNTKNQGINIGQLLSGITIQNCKFTGNRNAIYLNNTQGHIIKNNIITDNRTGIQLVNNVSNCLIEQNEITNNWTLGIVIYYNSADQPASTNVIVKNNNISGNWFSQVECKTYLSYQNLTTLYDFSGNWFGSATLNVTSAPAGEPGYSVQIPVAFNGTAANPGTNNAKISGDLVTKIKYSPWLNTGTDTEIGVLGFQGDFLNVSMDSNSPGGMDLQTVIDLVPSGATFIIPGSTTEYDHLIINHSITLQAANNNVKIKGGSPAITVNSTGVTILGFTFDNVDNNFYAIDILNDNFDVNIHSCNFLTLKGVRNQGTGKVDAINNWWMTNTGPKVISNIGGTGSEISGDVQYIPWIVLSATLTAPVNTISGISILPKFEWSSLYTGINLKYELKIYDSDGITVVRDIDDITDQFYQLRETDNVLLNNHTYYWNVTLKAGNNTNAAVSSKFSFKTILPAVASLATPSNASTVYTYSPVLFTWSLNQQVGSLTFAVQYMKHSSLASGHSTPNASDWAKGSPLVTIVDAGSDIMLNSEVLDPGTKYWWRVITYSDSKVVSYSASKYFTTSGGITVVKAIPSWPIGGNKVYTNNPTCYWYTNSGDLTDISFDLVVSNNSTFNGSQLFTYHTNNLYADVLDELTPGTTYYWKVKTYYKYVDATHYGDVSTPTTYATFKANGVGSLLTPVLSYPKGGVTVYTETPILYWYLGGSNEGLMFEVNINGHEYTTSDLYLDLSTVSESANLAYGGTYSWTVRAYSSAGSIISASASFKIAGGIAQGRPLVSWPVGNATVYEIYPTLYWYVSGSTLGLDKYTVAWTKINPASNGFNWATSNDVFRHDITDLSQTNFNLDDNLDYGQKYYWAVASHQSTGYSTWSSSSFTLVGTVGSIVPVVSYPKGGVTIGSTSATFSWFVNGSTLGIQGYKLIYSTRADMDANDATNTTVVGTTGNWITDQFLSVSNLVPGATYYWKVASYNGTDYSWSNIGVFSIASSAETAVVPMIGSPNNGVVLQTESPMLTWVLPTMAKTPLTYELQYSTQQDLSVPTTISGIKDPAKIISSLKSDQVYYWRVRSMTDKGQYSAYSETGKFVMASVTAVEKKDVVPEQFALDQNYPNPFNPSTVINFGLPKEAFVTLKIYNILGQEIKTLISEYRSAGTYNVQWNGDDNSGNKVQSGTYIYRIVASDNVSAKKMVMIK